jgi:hypothetical protein
MLAARKNAEALRAHFLAHECTSACLITESEATLAELNSDVSLSTTEVQQCALVLGLRSGTRKRKGVFSLDHTSNKRARTSLEASTTAAHNSTFPIMLSQAEKDPIVHEFRESTNNSSMKRYECSFCGKFELAMDVKMRSKDELDITLLDQAVIQLRNVCHQPQIESFNPSSLINSLYVLCHLCNSAVTRNSFCSIPLCSYANGLWIGKVPDELKDLTFLEEQCIARARATKCMYKLSLGPSGQFAARGNVCILPQDSTSFLNAMPAPLSQI